MRLPYETTGGGRRAVREVVERVDATGLDRVCVGDHVTFNGGQGFDGLVQATAVAATSERVSVQTAVYLLALRHPVTVARQVSSLAALAPGRFLFGVGLGGEDPDELLACGVDPASRGRRMNEAIAIVRSLLAGETVTVEGEFFHLGAVRVLPPPRPPVPIIVGGRSNAALRRVAAHGDGWLALWVSPERLAAGMLRIEELAEKNGRSGQQWQHGLHLWCGIGSSTNDTRNRLAAAMERLYRTPFARFERYCPSGPPAQIAGFLQPYVEAGCRSFNLVAVSGSPEEAIDGAEAVRESLNSTP